MRYYWYNVEFIEYNSHKKHVQTFSQKITALYCPFTAGFPRSESGPGVLLSDLRQPALTHLARRLAKCMQHTYRNMYMHVLSMHRMCMIVRILYRKCILFVVYVRIYIYIIVYIYIYTIRIQYTRNHTQTMYQLYTQKKAGTNKHNKTLFVPSACLNMFEPCRHV